MKNHRNLYKIHLLRASQSKIKMWFKGFSKRGGKPQSSLSSSTMINGPFGLRRWCSWKHIPERRRVNAGFKSPSFCGSQNERTAPYREASLVNPHSEKREKEKDRDKPPTWSFYVACNRSWLWSTYCDILNIWVTFPKECSTLYFCTVPSWYYSPSNWAMTEVGFQNIFTTCTLGSSCRTWALGWRSQLVPCVRRASCFASRHCSCKISCSFHCHKVLNRTFVSLLWDSDSQG